MRLDYVISLTRKDRSQRVVHIYGQPAPQPGAVIAVPIDGEMVRARIQTTGTNTAETAALEI